MNSPWWQVALVLLLAAAVSYPTLQGELLNFDDERYIQHNTLLDDFSWSRVFRESYDGHYHPVTILSLALDRALSKDWVFMHHAVNWLLHLANTLLLFLLFRFLFPQTQRAALIAAGLFAIHPQAVESYAWMSERKNVLYSFFLLSAALSYGRYLRRKQPRWWLIALLLFGLSLLSKAQAVSLLPLLFLIDWREGRSLRERKLYVDKLPFLLLVVAMLLLSWQVQSSTWASDKLVNNSGLERFFIASWALLRYFGGAVLPLGLSPFHPYPGASGMELQFYHYAAALVWPVLGFALWHSWRKNALLFFSLSFFLIHLFLLLKFVPYPHGNYYLAHRYNYLPLAGLMLGLTYLWLHYGRLRPWALSLGALYVMGLMHLSRGELAVWQNSQSLWSRVIERYPGYGQAYNMSALAHLQKGENQAAVKQWRRQLAVDPQASDAYYNLALLYLNEGEAQKTLAIIDQGADQIGQELSTYALRIQALGKLKRREEALALAEEALARWPEKHQFVKYKSQALSGMERYQEAYDYFAPRARPEDRALLAALESQLQQKDPRYQEREALFTQATEALKKGCLEAALQGYEQLLQLDSNHYQAQLNRASVLARMAKLEEAESGAKKAQKLNPERPEAYVLLAEIAGSLGKPSAYCAYYRKAQERGYALTAAQRQNCPGI